MFSLMGVFRLLGLKRSSALAGGLARAIGPNLPLTKRARNNLTLCFPDMTSEEMVPIIADMWENLGRNFAEYAHFNKFDAYSGQGYITVEGGEIIDRLQADGNGMMFFSGHFANWELFPLVLKGRNIPLAGIYRAPNNPYTDKWILDQRQGQFGATLFPKGTKGAKQMIHYLKDKHAMGMLVDQKLNDGVAVPFFGHDAMTAPAAAQMSLKFGCPLVPYSTERIHDHHFKIVVHEPLDYTPTGKRSDDAMALMIMMNQFLESQIRARPSQWLWLHNRWPKR